MAAGPGCSSKIVTNTDDSNELNEKLDLFSDKFDPLAYLYSDKVKVPRPDAKVFDNLAVWNSFYQRGGETRKPGKKQDKPAIPERKWLPHQLPIQSTKEKRIGKNVFIRMETVQGPLALLRKYITEKTRIKIITRNEKGIRGYCTAFLLAFDKHFNFVLEEVDEVWKRSIKVKKIAFLELENDSEQRNIQENSRNMVKLPIIESKQISKNTEECRRHVDQMLMRGEHVVLVCVAPEDKKESS